MPHPQCGEWPDFDATNLRWLLEPADLHPPTFAVPGALWEPAGRPLYVCRQVRGYPPVTMRLVIARCSVDYRGRLTAHLPTATRLIMVKADGCVAIHADGGAYKPLNWMNAPNTLVEEEARWVVTNPKGEELTIRIEEVVSDHHFDLGQDPGLEKDGVEAHLQELLAAKPEVLEEGLVVVRREYPTDIGPVDLLCRSEDGDTVAVEIKRKGEMDGVEQLTRYLDRLGHDSRLHPLRGVLAATIIAPQAKVLAAARGISCVEVDYEQLRGAPSNHLRLF